jgi:hypothetical protein
MMTFKELKKLVKLPLYKEQRVPTVKALEESGVSVVAEKILENHGSISVYQNGYVIYRAHKRVTVFSLRNCVHYKYDACDSESVGKVWRIIGWKKLHKKKNTRLGERIDIIFSTRRVFHSAGMCLLEAEGFHPCRQVGFAGI